MGNDYDVDGVSEGEVESGAGTEAVSKYTNLGDSLLHQSGHHLANDGSDRLGAVSS